jgi:RNA-binding protein YlmH
MAKSSITVYLQQTKPNFIYESMKTIALSFLRYEIRRNFCGDVVKASRYQYCIAKIALSAVLFVKLELHLSQISLEDILYAFYIPVFLSDCIVRYLEGKLSSAVLALL